MDVGKRLVNPRSPITRGHWSHKVGRSFFPVKNAFLCRNLMWHFMCLLYICHAKYFPDALSLNHNRRNTKWVVTQCEMLQKKKDINQALSTLPPASPLTTSFPWHFVIHQSFHATLEIGPFNLLTHLCAGESPETTGSGKPASARRNTHSGRVNMSSACRCHCGYNLFFCMGVDCLSPPGPGPWTPCWMLGVKTDIPQWEETQGGKDRWDKYRADSGGTEVVDIWPPSAFQLCTRQTAVWCSAIA